MAKHLTDKQKKQVIAAYVECGSYNAVAKKFGISDTTVKRVILNNPETMEKVEHKKAQNTADILEYMESQKMVVCQFIGKALEAMMNDGKLASATINQISTALGTVIDKWTGNSNNNLGLKRPENNLFEVLKESIKDEV